MKQNIIAKAVGSQRIVLVVGLEGVPVVVEQVKDIINAEIEQVLSLSKEKWQRKKLRLPHSQKREVEKPQKRRSREPTLLKDYRRFCQSESDVHGSETEIRGSECKIHGSECGNRHIRSHNPLFRSEKSLPLKGNFRGV